MWEGGSEERPSVPSGAREGGARSHGDGTY